MITHTFGWGEKAPKKAVTCCVCSFFWCSLQCVLTVARVRLAFQGAGDDRIAPRGRRLSVQSFQMDGPPLPDSLDAAMPPTHMASRAERREKCRNEWLELHMDLEVLQSAEFGAEYPTIPPLSDPRLEAPLDRVLVKLASEEAEWREGAAALERRWADEANALIARWRAEDAARLDDQRKHAIGEAQSNESALSKLTPAVMEGWGALLSATRLNKVGIPRIVELCRTELCAPPSAQGAGATPSVQPSSPHSKSLPASAWLGSVSEAQQLPRLLEAVLDALRNAADGVWKDELPCDAICAALRSAAQEAASEDRQRRTEEALAAAEAEIIARRPRPMARPLASDAQGEADSMAMMAAAATAARAIEATTGLRTPTRRIEEYIRKAPLNHALGLGLPEEAPSPPNGSARSVLLRRFEEAANVRDDSIDRDVDSAAVAAAGGGGCSDGGSGHHGKAARIPAAEVACDFIPPADPTDEKQLTPLAVLALLLMLVDRASPLERLDAMLSALLPPTRVPDAPLTFAEQRIVYKELSEACRIAVAAAVRLAERDVPPDDDRIGAEAERCALLPIREAFERRPSTWGLCPPDARAFGAWCAITVAPNTIGVALAGGWDKDDAVACGVQHGRDSDGADASTIAAADTAPPVWA